MDHKRVPRPKVGPLQYASGAWSRIAAQGAAIARATTQPAFVIALMLLAASACAVTGVWLLVGTAWAFVAASVVLFVLAGIALRGMTHG